MKATEQFNFYEDSKRFLIILTDGNDEEPEKLTKIKDKLSGMGIHSIAVGHNHAGRHVSVNIFLTFKRNLSIFSSLETYSMSFLQNQ